MALLRSTLSWLLLALAIALGGWGWSATSAATAEGQVTTLQSDLKAADDKASEGDYMLDSDDCIKVARGQWKRSDYGDPIVASTKNVKPTDWTAS